MMKITKERIHHAMQLHVNSIVFNISKESDVSLAEAYRRFVQTKTYSLLMSEKSKLYTQSFMYVQDLYVCEMSGDWESWMQQ